MSSPPPPSPTKPPDRLAATDEQLLIAVSDDDTEAFEELYDRYSPVLYPLCLRILQDASEAQAVLLDVFWEVWRNRGRFDPSRGSARTYLVMMARSRAIDHLRASKRRHENRQQLYEDRPDCQIRQLSQQAPEQRVIDAEHGQLLHRALELLTHDQRETLQLAYFEGLTHQQIADKTTMPLGSVKTHIRQGLIKLRSILRGTVSEEG